MINSMILSDFVSCYSKTLLLFRGNYKSVMQKVPGATSPPSTTTTQIPNSIALQWIALCTHNDTCAAAPTHMPIFTTFSATLRKRALVILLDLGYSVSQDLRRSMHAGAEPLRRMFERLERSCSNSRAGRRWRGWEAMEAARPLRAGARSSARRVSNVSVGLAP